MPVTRRDKRGHSFQPLNGMKPFATLTKELPMEM
jgi:hypothetical protein